MKAKGNSILVTLGLTTRPDGLSQGLGLPRYAVPVFVLLPFAFCLLPL
jgi:hypothetical protein